VLIKIPKTWELRESEVTDPDLYRSRRRFLQAGVYAFAGLALGGCDMDGGKRELGSPDDVESVRRQPPLANVVKSPLSIDVRPTPYEYVTTYNNFVELGSGKRAPARYADDLVTRPWTVRVDGECERPGELAIEDILQRFPREERIYRLRCVEAWAMVVPWVGFSLADLLRMFQPTSRAKYVAFQTLHDPENLRGQRRPLYDWPYREGLRMDEAMHPLAMLATGLYGEELPPQNGAPLRLVVPWKYGFKSIKSIVRITFTERQPATTWNRLQPDEYGFFANVNPQVDHPRWSQKRHRVIGADLFAARERTLMFNGYADAVASLYAGMDLGKFY